MESYIQSCRTYLWGFLSFSLGQTIFWIIEIPSNLFPNVTIEILEYRDFNIALITKYIPDCFWNESELDPKTLERKSYWF